MNKKKSPFVIILSPIIVVTAFLSNIFGSYSGLQELIKETCIRLRIELSDKSLSALIIILIIIVLAIFYHLVKNTKKNVYIENQKEEKVRQVYLKWLGKDLHNRLKSNLHRATFIMLDKKEELNKVDTSLFQDYYSTVHSKDIKSNFIEDYLTRDEKRILLLGAPGSGKTTTLLKILEKFHSEAISNYDCEIPIYLNLSSWGNAVRNRRIYSRKGFNLFKRQRTIDSTPDIKDWIIDQLINNHALFSSSKIVEEWLNQKKLILLLDGLDEANEKLRSKLVAKLNEFIKEHTRFDTKLIICSRIADYEALVESTSTKLFLDGAVLLQPFSSAQIDEYLEYTDSSVVRKIISEDEDVKRMASNPLMLSIMVLAYRSEYNPPKISDEMLSYTFKKLYLFSSFVNAMIKRKVLRDNSNSKISENMYDCGNELLPLKITKRINMQTHIVRNYLSWMARSLSTASRTIFSYKNVFSLLKNGDMSSKLILTTHLLFASILAATVFFMIAPNTIFSMVISSYPSNKLIICISIILFSGVIISYLMQKLNILYIRLEKFNLREFLLIMAFWPIYIILASYIFSGLNLIFPKYFIGTILPIAATIIINIILLLSDLDLRHKDDRNHFIFWNLALPTGAYIGIFLLGEPTIYTSIFLSILAIFFPILVDDEDKNYILHIFIIFIGGCFLSIFSPLLTALGAIILLLVTLVWNKIGYNLHLRIFEEILVDIVLKASGKIPFRFRRFIDYCSDALLIRKVQNGFEFNHRYIRDYFALQHIFQFDETYSIEKRRDITKDLVKLKDASCDVLLELIEDEDKQVRLACIEGLGNIGTSLAAQVLIKIIDTTEKGLSDLALNSLKKIKDFSSIPLLFRFARSHPYGSSNYNAAIYAMAGMDGLHVLNNASELESLIEDEAIEERIKWAAFSALTKLDHNLACSKLVQYPQLLKAVYYNDINAKFIKQLNTQKYLHALMHNKDSNYNWVEYPISYKHFVHHYDIFLTSLKRVGLYFDFDDIKAFIDEKEPFITMNALLMLTFFHRKKAISELVKLKASNNEQIRVLAQSILHKKILFWKLKAIPTLLPINFSKFKTWVTKKASVQFQLLDVKLLNFTQKEKALNKYLNYLKGNSTAVKKRCAKSLIRYNLRSAVPELLAILKTDPDNPEIIKVLMNFKALDLLDIKSALTNMEYMFPNDFISVIKNREPKELLPYFDEFLEVYRNFEFPDLLVEEVFRKKFKTSEIINKLKMDLKKEYYYSYNANRLLIAYGIKDIIPFTIDMITKRGGYLFFYDNADILNSYFAPNITFESILESFSDTDQYLRLASALILARTWPQESFLHLLNFLEHSKAEVRYSAAFALGEIGNTRSLLPLKKLLDDSGEVSVTVNDEHRFVYDAVIDAVEKIGTPESKTIIEDWKNGINQNRKTTINQVDGQ